MSDVSPGGPPSGPDANVCENVEWTMDTDSALGAYDQEYIDADDPDDVTTDPASNECILDPNGATVNTDLSGCITGIETGIIIGGTSGAVTRRRIRYLPPLGHLKPIRVRLKKKL